MRQSFLRRDLLYININVLYLLYLSINTTDTIDTSTVESSINSQKPLALGSQVYDASDVADKVAAYIL